MATAQQVLDRATQRSALNNPDLIPVAQILGYMTTLERQAFIAAARRDPDFFGKEGTTSVRSSETAGWNLASSPGDVAGLTKVEVKAITGTVANVAVGDKVNLVRLRWPDLMPSPRAYIRGRTIFQWKSELGTDSSNMVTQLTIFYSQLPSSVTSLTQTLTIPDEWTDLIVVPLAKLFAVRDNRDQLEVQVLDAEHAQNFQLFLEHVAAFDHGAVKPLIAVPAATGTVPGQNA